MIRGKAPIVVTIKRGKHATQPFTVTIDPAGRAEPYKMRQRYADRKGAKRGALRQLKANRSDIGTWSAIINGIITPIRFA